MFSSAAEPSPLELVTIGDFDPQSERSIEYDFVGRVIAGRYTVRAKLGGGGMADVYRATDEELGVDVVIKLLKPRMASDELRARMVQEARAAAQVRHANLVRVFGTGKLDGTAFIVMELLEGPNLEQFLHERSEQRLPWQEAVAMLLPALEALHAIHERGYVHRDIKTGNILITHPAGRPPTAIVIDLGLVKADRALRDASSPPTTEAGRLLCTPGYTSPEQAAGRPVDRRSDIYSMGVTLYRVLAGRLPFHEARGKSPMVVLAKHIYNDPTRLAEAAASARIPPAIADIVEWTLRKEPAERPQTMLEFAEALRKAAGALDAAPTQRALRRPHEMLLCVGLGAALCWGMTPRRAVDTVPAAAAPIGVDAPAEPETAQQAVREPADDLPGAPPVAAAPVTAPGPTPVFPTLPTTRPRRSEAQRSAIAARFAPEVQRCVDEAGGSGARLAVRVTIEGPGRVSAAVIGAEETPLSRCVDQALRPAPLASAAPLSFTHIFKLRAAPEDP